MTGGTPCAMAYPPIPTGQNCLRIVIVSVA